MVAKMMMAIASENTRKPSSEAQALKQQSQVTIILRLLQAKEQVDSWLPKEGNDGELNCNSGSYLQGVSQDPEPLRVSGELEYPEDSEYPECDEGAWDLVVVV